MMNKSISKRLAADFKNYDAYHRTHGNKVCHLIGIPLIVVSLLGLLGRLPIGSGLLIESEFLRSDAGTLVLVAAMARYFYLDWKIAIPFGLSLFGCYFLGRATPVPALWAFFILGWAFQYLGHLRFEKKSPAFYQNFSHLMTGPVWIFSRLVGYY